MYLCNQRIDIIKTIVRTLIMLKQILSVREMCSVKQFLFQIKGMTYENAYKESLKLLKQLDLEYVKDMKMKSCSFGTQRRICLAMALIGNTKV